MKTFIRYNIPVLEQINTPEGRRYRTPEGNLYPSVTTILGSISAPYLDEWRLKVGVEVADKISKAASTRGTLIHEACECYLTDQEIAFSMYQPVEEEMFTNLIPHLNTFDEIHALETRLYSDSLKVAGTVDCIARIGREMYVIDFKTSSRLKSRDDIHSYFMQCAAYARMFYDLTGVVCKKMRILMTTQDDGVLTFDENVIDWLPSFVKLRREMM